MEQQERMAILDYASGEIFIFQVAKEERTQDIFDRKGFGESDIIWIRGDLKIHFEQ